MSDKIKVGITHGDYNGIGYELILKILDDGRLAAFGPHDELYATCPAYRKMVDLQKLEEEGAMHNA